MIVICETQNNYGLKSPIKMKFVKGGFTNSSATNEKLFVATVSERR